MSNISTIDRFPLLRLPQIALQEILKPMNPIELISLSKTNLGIQQNVKNFLNTKQCQREYKIKLDIKNSQKISIDATNHSYTYQFKTSKLKTKNKVFYGKDKVTLYSENIVEDFKEHLEYVLDILNCDITTLGLFGLTPSTSKGGSIVDWINYKQKPVKCLVMRLPGDQFKKDVHYVLNSLIITDCIHLHTRVDDLFELVIPPLSKHLYIANCYWITLSQLLKFNCPIIQTGYSNLTNQDINEFLSSWIKLESHLNLKFFETKIYRGNMNEICIGLKIKLTDPKVKTFDVHFMEGTLKVEIVGGIEIRRNDGVTTTLSSHDENRNTYFKMIIN